ncbi:N-acetyltransferase [Planococcus halotolerans]|uniref:N-acetyltransferase n=2 Tax=Planococcus halotolerans TaxID=2233542 RepID=A0A365KXK8_9BACL|nr:N-acetyltransferase [Planococcus halotolerans]RAZ77912.1 N-acetyltransferase [Planococcus halotolerans]
MEKMIRPLTKEDLPKLKAMETGIEDDYVIRVFDRISSGNNKLFGLFTNDQLVSVGGLTVFAKHYAMLGRMRSDLRYRGNDLSTSLMSQVLEEAFKLPDIKWVGANTQEENIPAQRVLKKIGLAERHISYGASALDVSSLENGGTPWKREEDISNKRQWLRKLFIDSAAVFPYECYYPFPASEEMFDDKQIAGWNFFVNPQGDRLLITKKDFKKYNYLQAVFPFEDVLDQPGLWETIALAHQQLASELRKETHIWMDLTKQQASALPENHPFNLPSPWMLFGKGK